MDYKILKKIKIARLVQGMKQEDIAKQLNVSIPTYSRFERGVSKTNYLLLKKVCAILELNLNDIENESTSSTYNEPEDIVSQLKILIKLLKEQQKTNQLVLEKLNSLTLELDKI